MTRGTSILLTLLSFPPLTAAGPETPVTLAEAVQTAMERHQDVGKARAAADALRGKIKEVRAQALPEVNIVAAAQRLRDPSLLNASGLDQFPAELLDLMVPRGVNLFDYSVTVKQPLFTQGKIGTALRLAEIEAKGALTEIERVRQDVALATARSFFDLMWAERYQKLVEETQSQKQQHADMARARFKNGVATEVDVLRSDVAVANGKPDLVRAANAVRQARSLLNYYLGRDLDTATSLAGDFEQKAWADADHAALEKEALAQRPEMQRLRLSERSADTQLKLAHAENRLRIDFSGSYGIMARLPENLVDRKYSRWTAGVNLTLPVFDGFKRNGLVEQAVANTRSVRLERQKNEQQIRLSIQQGLDSLAAAAETIRAARANIQQAEKVLGMTQNNYKFGAATTLDVMDAQTALSVARTDLLKGLHDYSVARAELRWALGKTPWE
jgi:outer membrane protein